MSVPRLRPPGTAASGLKVHRGPRGPLVLIAALGLAPPATGQSVPEIGLVTAPRFLPTLHGSFCGPLSCTPHGFELRPGGSHILSHFGAPGSLFCLMVGQRVTCTTIRGIGNALTIADPIALAAGSTGATAVGIPCGLGPAPVTIAVPAGLPPGTVLRFQAIGIAGTGAVAFGPTLEGSTAR